MTIGRVEIYDRVYQKNKLRAVVVAQVVERLLLIPEVRSSNPVIGKNLYWTFTVNCIEKTRVRKRGRELPNFLKNKLQHVGRIALV